ncbi:MAG: DUF2339 domain-containing protein [Lachnospiraceae bacterium]|nr:DUF2339 domain-containing protein [Lachnospiraceae bacterium]
MSEEKQDLTELHHKMDLLLQTVSRIEERVVHLETGRMPAPGPMTQQAPQARPSQPQIQQARPSQPQMPQQPAHRSPAPSWAPQIPPAQHGAPHAAASIYRMPAPRVAPPLDAVRPVSQGKKDRNIEFAVGASVLSVIGVLFVIAALVLFGTTMLSRSLQGLFLYVIFAALIPVSELFVRKKIERFSQILTALALIGLYASTVVNYLYLHTIGPVISIGIVVAITVFALFLSKNRDSCVMRIILHLGILVTLFPYGDRMALPVFVNITLIIAIVNLAAVFLPVVRNRHIADLFQAASFGLFSLAFVMHQYRAVSTTGTDLLYLLPVFFALLVHVLLIVFRKPDTTFRYFLLIAGGFLAFIALTFFYLMRMGRDYSAFLLLAATILSLPYAAGAALRLMRKKEAPDEALFMVMLQFLYASFLAGYQLPALHMICALVCLALSVLLHTFGRFEKRHLAITIIAVCGTLSMISIPIAYGSADYTRWMWWLLAAALLASFFVTHTFHTAILVLTIVYVCFGYIRSVPTLTDMDYQMITAVPSFAIALILLVAYLLPAMREGVHPQVFAFAFIPVTFLHLSLIARHTEVLPYLFFLASGLILTVFFAGKVRVFGERFRLILLFAYLTYMTLVVRVSVPVVISIVLMALSIAAVAAGFFFRERTVRIYGLSLAIVTCFKIALFDFAELLDTQRILLFLVSGILALVISFLYIRLEKRLKELPQTQQPPVQQPPR